MAGAWFFFGRKSSFFLQNFLKLSQVSGLGGHGPWFSLLDFPLDYHPPPIVGQLDSGLSNVLQPIFGD